MRSDQVDSFFSNINFRNIVDGIKNIYTSDGAMSILLDFERVLDSGDVYAFKNWLSGELVQGPDAGRYDCSCVFMWPYKLMPDPRGAIRLTNIGCKVAIGTTEIEVPVEVKNPDDFVPGTHYPRKTKHKVWLIEICIPNELMNDIKEGTIDLSGELIDLSDIEDAYDDDLDEISMEDDLSAEEQGLGSDAEMEEPIQ